MQLITACIQCYWSRSLQGRQGSLLPLRDSSFPQNPHREVVSPPSLQSKLDRSSSVLNEHACIL